MYKNIMLFTLLIIFSQITFAEIIISDDMRVINNGGGNILYITSDQGNILIDSGFTKDIGILSKQVSNLSYLVTSHRHNDHIGGNAYFGSLGVPIIAQQNTTKYLSKGSVSIAKEGRPTISFDQIYQLKFAGLTLDMEYFPNAHTDGDITVFIPERNLLHMADISFGKNYNYIDKAYGGTINGMIEATKKIINMVNNDTIIIPGHGDILDKKQLQKNLAMFIDIRDTISKHKKVGKSLEEVLKLKPTAKYDKNSGGAFISGDRFTEIVYTTLP